MLRLSTFNKFIVSVFVLLMLGASRLFPEEIIKYNVQLAIIVVLSIILWSMTLRSKETNLQNEVRFLNYYFVLYVIAIAITIYSSAKYGYSMDTILKNVVLPYSLPLASYGIVLVFNNDKSTVPLLSLVSKFVIAMLVLRMFSWVMYNFRGAIFFPRLLLQYEGWIRDGFQRVEAGMLFGVALSYITVQSMQRSIRGNIHKLLLIFMLLFLLVVTRVRFQTTLSLASIVAAYVFSKSNTRGNFIFKLLSFSLIGIFFLYNYHIIESFFSLISSQGQYGESTLVRFQGVRHYFLFMSQQHAYFGLGFLIRGNPIVEAMMARNQWSIYYLDDLGMLGTVVQLGLFTLITHGLVFVKAIRVLLKSRYLKDQSYFAFLLCLTVYLIGSNLFLNMFDGQRIFDVPFYLAIYSFMGVQIKKQISMDNKEVSKEVYGREI
ncbi:hypothetical protein [Streptococcus ruminantium]|uniref:Uncharacterized protein n=2 Tax=Streptococcus ruminantium TaxID=1917441 RepID=A0A2Z5TP20_9STRE|nr:hypothetical protein [Streptococcus ruminantium]BBA92996.1 hypothetical protein SR187_6960 [Streptococcus ruminantium]